MIPYKYMRKSRPAHWRGFTLIELLIVIAIIIILLAFTLISIRGQIAKAADAKRKSDLYTLKNALEEYNNDNGVFPPEGSVDSCGSPFFTYLKSIPCDPQTRIAYGYFLSAVTGGYRVCAVLSDKTDPAIAVMGCAGSSGCGVGGSYNYCLAQGTMASAVGTGDERFSNGSTPTPTSVWNPTEPTPTPDPGNHWACGKDAVCRYYSSDPTQDPWKCPRSFATANACNYDCPWDPTIRCP